MRAGVAILFAAAVLAGCTDTPGQPSPDGRLQLHGRMHGSTSYKTFWVTGPSGRATIASLEWGSGATARWVGPRAVELCQPAAPGGTQRFAFSPEVTIGGERVTATACPTMPAPGGRA